MGTRVKVVKVGNSLRIAIPMPLAEALGIKAGDYLDLEIKGQSLSIDVKKSKVYGGHGASPSIDKTSQF